MKKYTLQLVVPQALHGLQSTINKLNEYEGEQVFIQVIGECGDVASLRTWSAKDETPDFILIFEKVTDTSVGKEKARNELLGLVRKFYSQPTKLIFILSEDDKEELLPFVNELIKFNVQSFYFVQEFRPDDVAGWIFAEKELKDNVDYLLPYIKKGITDSVEITGDKYDSPDGSLTEEEVEIKQNMGKEVIREVPVERIVEKKVYVPGIVSIGIINLAHGAGATTAAVSLAESFAQDGYDTAVIAMDDKEDLHYLNRKRLKANYVIPSSNEEKALYLTALHMEGYHFIVQDFGNLFPILADGSLKVELMKAKEPEIKEFMRCTYKVAVGFSNDWNIRKLEFLANNDKFDLNSFFFHIKEGGNELRKYNLNLCSDYDAIADMIRQQAGLEQERKEKKSAFPFLLCAQHGRNLMGESPESALVVGKT